MVAVFATAAIPNEHLTCLQMRSESKFAAPVTDRLCHKVTSAPKDLVPELVHHRFGTRKPSEFETQLLLSLRPPFQRETVGRRTSLSRLGRLLWREVARAIAADP